MKSRVFAAISLTFLLMVPGSPAAAQARSSVTGDCPEGCWMCWNILVEGSWYHNHDGNNGDLYGCVGSANSHLGSVVAGRCLTDGSCNELAAEIPAESEIVALVRANAAHNITQLQQEYPTLVAVDLDDRMVRVSDCEGLTTFSIPLPDTLVTLLSSVVPGAVIESELKRN